MCKLELRPCNVFAKAKCGEKGGSSAQLAKMGMQFFMSANRKSANIWAYSAIANKFFLGVAVR
jgi:hypothetical protein